MNPSSQSNNSSDRRVMMTSRTPPPPSPNASPISLVVRPPSPFLVVDDGPERPIDRVESRPAPRQGNAHRLSGRGEEVIASGSGAVVHDPMLAASSSSRLPASTRMEFEGLLAEHLQGVTDMRKHVSDWQRQSSSGVLEQPLRTPLRIETGGESSTLGRRPSRGSISAGALGSATSATSSLLKRTVPVEEEPEFLPSQPPRLVTGQLGALKSLKLKLSRCDQGGSSGLAERGHNYVVAGGASTTTSSDSVSAGPSSSKRAKSSRLVVTTAHAVTTSSTSRPVTASTMSLEQRKSSVAASRSVLRSTRPAILTRSRTGSSSSRSTATTCTATSDTITATASRLPLFSGRDTCMEQGRSAEERIGVYAASGVTSAALANLNITVEAPTIVSSSGVLPGSRGAYIPRTTVSRQILIGNAQLAPQHQLGSVELPRQPLIRPHSVPTSQELPPRPAVLQPRQVHPGPSGAPRAEAVRPPFILPAPARQEEPHRIAANALAGNPMPGQFNPSPGMLVHNRLNPFLNLLSSLYVPGLGGTNPLLTSITHPPRGSPLSEYSQFMAAPHAQPFLPGLSMVSSSIVILIDLLLRS